MEISRSNFVLVDVAFSRHFGTSGFGSSGSKAWKSPEVTFSRDFGLRHFGSLGCKAWKYSEVTFSRLTWQSLVTLGLRASRLREFEM
jgi:hypothetical protein